MERGELIDLIERRMPGDEELGRAWAFLRAGCEFFTGMNGDQLSVHITHKTFDTFESGDGDLTETFSVKPSEEAPSAPLPPPKRRSADGVKVDYSRVNLLNICKLAVVPQAKWMNRDSPSAQEQVGRCLSLLLAGLEFTITTEGDNCVTDDRTIWVEVGDDTFYLPTLKRITESNGGDWY